MLRIKKTDGRFWSMSNCWGVEQNARDYAVPEELPDELEGLELEQTSDTEWGYYAPDDTTGATASVVRVGPSDRDVILDCSAPTALAVEYYNNLNAEVDAEGDVWVGDHWADDEDLAAFAAWLRRL